MYGGNKRKHGAMSGSSTSSSAWAAMVREEKSSVFDTPTTHKTASTTSLTKKTSPVPRRWNGFQSKNVKPSSSSKSAATTKPHKKRNTTVVKKPIVEPREEKREQMFLDFGQKSFAKTCGVCGMFYYPGQENDEALHKTHHERFQNGISFKGWTTNEQCIHRFDDDSRVLEVTPAQQKKPLVLSIVDMMNRDLGGTRHVDETLLHGQERLFLLISAKKVACCAIVRRVTSGYRLADVPELHNPSHDKSTQTSNVERPPAIPESASLGVEKMWTHRKFRRQGLITKLLDAIRLNFQYGAIVPRSAMVFSQPTSDGKCLAARYTGTDNFLVFAGCLS